MEEDDSERSSVEPNPRKRSYASFTASRPHIPPQLPPQLGSFVTASSRTMAPSASLNRNFPPPPPQRWHGDGLDMRRPVMSRASHAQESQPLDNVIDLTSDSETPFNDTPRYTPTFDRGRSPVMPARTPEVIDLDDDDGDANDVIFERTVQHSPEIEFVSARTRIDIPPRPPRPPTPPRRNTIPTPAWFNTSHLPPLSTFGVRSQLGGMGRFTQAFLNGRNAAAAPSYGTEDDIFGTMDDALLNTPIRDEWRLGPIGMDYDRVPFNMGPTEAARPTTANSRIEPPGPVPDGYTRAPAEDDVVVCQNCDQELGTGHTPEQRQIWVIRRCGHCYCGSCIHARHNKKRVIAKCVCEGCNTVIRTSRSALTMLYI